MYGLVLVIAVLLIVQSTDLVLSALLLAGCFFTTAFWLAAWGFDYIAVVYQLVYLGAVVVLFLFVVMFLDNPFVEGTGAPLTVVRQSGSLMPYLVVWLGFAAPLVIVVVDVVTDLVVVTGAIDPCGLQNLGAGDGIQTAFGAVQVPLVQYFFTQGGAVLFFMGLLFTLALLFALFLILVFAV